MFDVCGKCGVPLPVSKELVWEPNGVISLARSPRNRMVFLESEAIDQVFAGIADLIGVPIEHIIIESRSRETRRYIERIFPMESLGEVTSALGGAEGGSLDLSPEGLKNLHETAKLVNQYIVDIATVYGYGHQTFGRGWERGDDFPWRSHIVHQPYSVLFMAADNLGSVEAFEGVDMRVRYDDIGQDTFEMEVYPGAHPVELQERLKRTRYEFKPGDIQYDRCQECGIPLVVAYRAWDAEKGTISDPETGRRMAIFGPLAVDSIFDDLEAELGEAIPEMVIEAQRRQIKKAWDVESWNKDGATFQQMMALRGLGNLTRFEGDRSGLTLTIENSCAHLMIIGTTRALVELVYKVESTTCEWELREDGDLLMNIKVG